MAAGSRAKLSSTPHRAEPPALRINRGHSDTAGLEQLLLQLAQSRAGGDGRLGAALDELRSRLNGPSKVAGTAQPSVQSNPIPHIESLEQRVADLARRVRQADEARGVERNGSSGAPNGADLDAQFRALNAALEASLNGSSLAALESDPNLAALESDSLAALESGRGEARQSELIQAIADLGPQIARVAHGAAVEVASHIEGSQQASDAMARLDAIQRDLQALTNRAGCMDGRTLTTLETISTTLQRLAQRLPVAAATAPVEPAAEDEPPKPGDSRRATRKSGDSRQVTRKLGDSRRATKEPDETPAPASGELAIEETGDTATDDAPAIADGQADEPHEPETVAIEPHAAAPRRLASDARKPRKILVFAAVVLLIVSAGLLYGRLNTRNDWGPGAPDQLAPAGPAPAGQPSGQPSGRGGGRARPPDLEGGGSQESPGRENTQRPSPKLETIPATRFDRASIPAARFDRASMIIVDPQPMGPGLILKSQSH